MNGKHLLALLFAWLTGLWLSPAMAAAGDDLLEPDKAFRLQTRVIDARTVEASWRIAEGYYLYRDKFQFESLDPAVKLQPPALPAGKRKDDPFFGPTEIFTKSVAVRLPLERTNTGDAAVRLRITAQGCNEPVGVCYPPITKEVSLNLPPAAATSGNGGVNREARSLKDLAQIIRPNAANDQEVVDPEKAFQVTVVGTGDGALMARFAIADCCYLYRDKMGFEVAGQGVKLGEYRLPAGKKKTDEFFGATEVYYGNVDVRLPVAATGALPEQIPIKVSYQGCSEKGVTICYPPATKNFTIAAASLGTPGTGVAQTPAPAPTAEPSKADASQPLLLALLAAFGAGLLLTFTPCVLPMIPILSSIIVGAGDRRITKWQGGLMSYTYVAGTALTYTLAGIVAGRTGEQLQAYFQNPWAIGTFSVILVLLALAMFGAYTLQMPSFVQSKLQQQSDKIRSRGGTYVGLFFMGIVSALIVGACVSPVLIGALSAAIATKDPVLGGGIMFALAHGQGVVLIATGVGAGWLLPRAGVWMDAVKQVFGVLLIAVAVYLLTYIPDAPVMYLWAAFVIAVSIYLGANIARRDLAPHWRYAWKAVEVLLLVWGVLAILGGLQGQRDILNPVPVAAYNTAVAANTGGTETAPSMFRPVRTMAELDNRLAEAKAAGKAVILDYYATWCTDCVRMEKSTFLDPKVRALVGEQFVALQADVTDPNDPESKAIKQRYGVYGPPAMLFFGADGAERRELRTYGYKSAEAFLQLLRKV